MTEEQELERSRTVSIEKQATVEHDEWYDATVVDIFDWEGTKYQSDELQMNHLWRFAVEGDGGIVEAAGFTPYGSPKLTFWFTAWPDLRKAYNEMPPGQRIDFDTDDLIGRKCRVKVALKPDSDRVKVVDLKAPKA
jgi:hypothetical protein